MDPKSGMFHELEPTNNMDKDRHERRMRELSKALAEKDDDRDGVYKRHFQQTNDPRARLHPGMADLVIKATKERVPAHWPIFSVGEGFDIGGDYAEIVKIHSNDLEIGVEFLAKDLPVGEVIEIKGHKFRVRKSTKMQSRFNFLLRPIVGRPHNYVK